MAIGQVKDAENIDEVNGLEDLEQPFIQQDNIVSNKDDKNVEGGSIGMVLLSTCVAVCGSFEFGSCVSIFHFSYVSNKEQHRSLRKRLFFFTKCNAIHGLIKRVSGVTKSISFFVFSFG